MFSNYLRNGASDHDPDEDECVNCTHTQQISKKRSKGNIQILKKELENDYLTPRTSFDSQWLNKLQQYVAQ